MVIAPGRGYRGWCSRPAALAGNPARLALARRGRHWQLVTTGTGTAAAAFCRRISASAQWQPGHPQMALIRAKAGRLLSGA
jgi:hypothetical protein